MKMPPGLVVGSDGSRPAEQSMPIVNPATGELVADAPLAGAADVDAAVAAALDAFPTWWRSGTPARLAAIEKFAQAVEREAEELAVMDTLCTGMPVAGMRTELRETVARSRRHMHDASMLLGDSAPASLPGDFHFTLKEPYGVVAVITPYNHPALFALQAIAAIAAGNTAVLKPPDQAPFSSLRLGQLALECFPPGVLNVVSGDGATTGEALTRHPDVALVSLTGSVRAGQQVLRSSAETAVRPVLLELGGKNPIVVCPDADVQAAAAAAVAGLNLDRCLGQSCTSNSRAIVHESVRSEFVDAVAKRFEALAPGDPMGADGFLGPLITRKHQTFVLEQVALAEKEGARVVAGGQAPGGEFAAGAYVRPTLLDDVDESMTIAREEIFGPVLGVMTWSEEDEAVRLANDIPFGLAGTVYTNDLSSAQRFVRDLEAGMIYVNSPVRFCRGLSPTPYKQSGIGDFPGGGLGDVGRYTRNKAVHMFPAQQR